MRVRAVGTIRVNPCNIQLITSQSCTQSLLAFWTSARLWVRDGTQFVYALHFSGCKYDILSPPLNGRTYVHTFSRYEFIIFK